MKLLKKIVCAAALLGAFQANAFQWGGQVTITGIYLYGNGNAFINTTNNLNPDSCSNPRYLALDTTSPNFKFLYANLLVAYSQNLPVSLNYNGCTGQYPLIQSVALPAVW
jgi:hypothetical protein